ncbi:hypothetical protein AOLI_G00156260 [Acnodon oligacanthus]
MDELRVMEVFNRASWSQRRRAVCKQAAITQKRLCSRFTEPQCKPQSLLRPAARTTPQLQNGGESWRGARRERAEILSVGFCSVVPLGLLPLKGNSEEFGKLDVRTLAVGLCLHTWKIPNAFCSKRQFQFGHGC